MNFTEFTLRVELEKQKFLKEERIKNLKRIDDETKEQSLRIAILKDSIKNFDGTISVCHFALPNLFSLK